MNSPLLVSPEAQLTYHFVAGIYGYPSCFIENEAACGDNLPEKSILGSLQHDVNRLV